MRVYFIHGILRTDTTISDLEFQTSARVPIVQDLPINNNTDEDWLIQGKIQANGFQCPATFTAKSQSKSLFPVRFNSLVACESLGTLVLVNSTTSQQFTYKVQGIATEPVAEGTLLIDCDVRSKVSEFNTVQKINYSQELL